MASYISARHSTFASVVVVVEEALKCMYVGWQRFYVQNTTTSTIAYLVYYMHSFIIVCVCFMMLSCWVVRSIDLSRKTYFIQSLYIFRDSSQVFACHNKVSGKKYECRLHHIGLEMYLLRCWMLWCWEHITNIQTFT